MNTLKTLSLLIPMSLMVGLSVTNAAPASPRERAQREALERQNPKERKAQVGAAQSQRAKGAAEDQASTVDQVLSSASGGKLDSVQLAVARETIYRVEVSKADGKSSQSLEIKMSEVAETLANNITSLKNSNEPAAIRDAKVELAEASIPLLTVAAKRYAGSDTNLVLARDAFARQVETISRMTAPGSKATPEEIAQHMEVVLAILHERDINPSLTDAELMALGLRRAYRDGIEKLCRDGSCKVPSDAVVEAGAKARLKDLKDCI